MGPRVEPEGDEWGQGRVMAHPALDCRAAWPLAMTGESFGTCNTHNVIPAQAGIQWGGSAMAKVAFRGDMVEEGRIGAELNVAGGVRSWWAPLSAVPSATCAEFGEGGNGELCGDKRGRGQAISREYRN